MEGGTCELICIWLLNAQRVLQGHFESIHSMSSPFKDASVLGAWKPPCLKFEEERPSGRRDKCEACFVGLKGPSTVTLASLHWSQKATQAIAKTSALNVFVRWSKWWGACKWASKAGFLFGFEDEARAAFDDLF